MSRFREAVRTGRPACHWYKSKAAGWAAGMAVAAALIVGASVPRLVSARTGQGSKPAADASGNAANGRKLYVKYGCYECHGYEGQGSRGTGPRLGPDPVPLEAMIAYVRKPTGEMPPYTDKVVSDQEMADIYAFLASRPEPPKNIPLLK